tara:strand:- start:3760 stop:4593 length:834 start_codon:yes stop_codon:yes gene_type:complete
MQWFLTTLIQYKNFLFFIILLGIGIAFTVAGSNFHSTKIQEIGVVVSGELLKPIHYSKSYLYLNETNESLLKENNHLRQELLDYKGVQVSTDLDSLNPNLSKYLVRSAEVLRNSYVNARNLLILDKGANDGIKQDMSVIGPDGIIGIVKQTSSNFSSVISILYQDFKINAKLIHTGAFGSLYWEGKDPSKMTFSDVSIINKITKGDTIVTGGMSAYFPKGIPIGIITDFDTPTSGGYYDIKVELFNNLTDLEHVYIIDNKSRSEFLNIQNQDKDASR